MAVSEQSTTGVQPDGLDFCGELAQQLRVDGIRASTHAGSGHPTSSMSAADVIAVLATRHLRYDWANPTNPANDHLIFSKGHASPLIYALFKAANAVTDDELMTYRTQNSRLQGHPTPLLPWVDVATGSLGQGLPIAVGVAIAGKYLDRLPYHVWAVCGDSEVAEGSIWEALDKAAYYKLGNLTAIIDVNRLGQRGETEFGWNTRVYRDRVEAFGGRALVVDGHNLQQIDGALSEARRGGDQPTVIIARTVKGKGFSEIEDRDGWHGKALPGDMAERAIAELGGIRNLRIIPLPPESAEPAPASGHEGPIVLPVYRRGDRVATRRAYGDALAALHVNPKVIALDGEVSNSTHSDEFQKIDPDHFFEMFIAEQQLVATAVGLAVRGYVPFASTFAAFFSRAYDFIRMAAISQADIRLSGSHAGCEIGPDGPSQMALEDIASLRAVHGSTILYPCDPNCTAKLVAAMVSLKGVSYLRTTRGAYPAIYEAGEEFPVGGSKVVRRGPADEVAIIGAGVTLHHALEAADLLGKEGVDARVIDLYSVKPLDVHTLREAARECGGRLIVVEDHYPEGGIGAAVMEALAADERPPRVVQLAVRGIPGSATPDQLMAAAGIAAGDIVEAARRLASQPAGR